MEVESRSCWFCRRPVLASERANRAPHAEIAVHTDCLRNEAAEEEIPPPKAGPAEHGAHYRSVRPPAKT